MTALGLDIGASKIYYVVLEGNKRLIEKEIKIPQPTLGNLFAISRETSLEIKRRKIKLQKAGVGVPGTIKEGRVDYAPNFPALKRVDLKNELKKIFGVPITLVNDAKAFIVAEAALGKAKKYKNIIGLTLGSGLGGGIIIDGSLYLGKGNAGEIGHTIVDIQNLKEAEDFVTAKFFKKDPVKLQKLAEKSNLGARKAYEDFGKNLGVVIANLINIFDPEVIVLGGGLSRAYPLFRKGMEKTARKLIVNPEGRKTPVLKSSLGPSAGAIGAALLCSKA